MEPWVTESETLAYQNKLFRILERTNRSPRSGRAHPFFVLSTCDWVNVVAVTPENRMVLVRQFRHGTHSVTWEIPGGAVDPGETDPLIAAKRELREETGYEAPEWFFLGTVEPNPAIQDNRCHTYLAWGSVPTGAQDPDETEEIDVDTYDLDKVPGMVERGEITHSLVLTAFYHFDRWRRENPDRKLPGKG